MNLRIAIVALLFTPCAWSQDDVHITPRLAPIPSKAASEAVYRVNVDLALVPVAVTEPGGKPQIGLQKAHFRLWYDGQEQDIKYFSSDDVPVSLGVILDRSGSMGWKLDYARVVLQAFADQANPQDEVFLITLADTIDVTGFTTTGDMLTGKAASARSEGKTSLLDAVYLGLQKMGEAKYQRRALVIISDGGDNHSRYTEAEIKRAVEEADVQVFTIGIFNHQCLDMTMILTGRSPCTTEEIAGPYLLLDLTAKGGGTGFSLTNMRDIPSAAARIGAVIRQEYVLGFTPKAASVGGGKYHKLKVKLQRLPKGLPPLRVDARQGMYAGAR